LELDFKPEKTSSSQVGVASGTGLASENQDQSSTERKTQYT
jgi:hypothetical protein